MCWTIVSTWLSYICVWFGDFTWLQTDGRTDRHWQNINYNGSIAADDYRFWMLLKERGLADGCEWLLGPHDVVRSFLGNDSPLFFTWLQTDGRTDGHWQNIICGMMSAAPRQGSNQIINSTTSQVVPDKKPASSEFWYGDALVLYLYIMLPIDKKTCLFARYRILRKQVKRHVRMEEMNCSRSHDSFFTRKTT
jgi:hypothetical protein